VFQSENRNEITYICILYVLVVALDVTVRNNMKKTVYSRGGFTIAELLIVLMIIGILVGVSVPVFTAQLEKTREATDIANERDCKAIAVSSFLNDGTNGTFFYDAASGCLMTTSEDIIVYGKGTMAGSIAEDHTKSIIRCIITPSGSISITWTVDGINGNADLGSYTPSLYLLDVFNKLKLTSYPVYSNIAGDANTQAVKAQLAESFGDTNINSWLIDRESGYQIVWITDIDVSTVQAGSYVRVMRYNTKKKTYTAAYVKVTTTTVNGVTYNVLPRAISTGYKEIAGQNDTTKQSYSSTLAVFNSASSSI